MTNDFVILVKNRPSLDEIDEGLPRHPGGVKVTLKHFPQVKYIIISHFGPLWDLVQLEGPKWPLWPKTDTNWEKSS